MSYLSLQTIIRSAAWSGAALVLAQISVFFSAGIGQDPLQFLHPPEEYASLLLKNPAALRLTLGFDAFLVASHACGSSARTRRSCSWPARSRVC